MKTILISIKIFLIFTIITGIIYPVMVTFISQVAFPAKSNGSLIVRNNKVIGSSLIGQRFDSPIYFTPRPSATGYNPLPSGASNFGLTNKKLKEKVDERRQNFVQTNQIDSRITLPSDVFFASASGLDPHISPAAAMLQVNRITQARNLNEVQKRKLVQLVQEQIESRQFHFLGEERVNVLLLNIELDKLP